MIMNFPVKNNSVRPDLIIMILRHMAEQRTDVFVLKTTQFNMKSDSISPTRPRWLISSILSLARNYQSGRQTFQSPFPASQPPYSETLSEHVECMLCRRWYQYVSLLSKTCRDIYYLLLTSCPANFLHNEQSGQQIR